MKTRILVFATAMGAGLLSAGLVQAQAEQYLIVAAGNGFSQSQVQAVQLAGGQILKVFPQIGVAVATSDDPGFSLRAKAITGVQSVVVDPVAAMVSDAQLPPAEPASKQEPALEKGVDLTPLQWGLQAIQVPAAWALGYTGKGVRVAVIDSGIMTRHPDLAPNLNLALSTSMCPYETVEFIPGGALGNFSHATHVAGIIAAANNGFGTTGVAPETELVAIKIGSDWNGQTRVSWILEAILYAAETHADVANLSLAVTWEKGNPEKVYVPEIADVPLSVALRAVNFAEQQGTLIVAAGGNYGENWDGVGNVVFFPRDLPGVLGVSATAPRECWAYDQSVYVDWPASYIDYGQRVIDLAAPGGDVDPTLGAEFVTVGGATFRAFAFNMILSTSSNLGQTGDYDKKGTWSFSSGTSMATPHVSGVAALTIQAHGGGLTPAQIRAILAQSADDLGKAGNDDFYGAGRVNALRAVLQ